MTQCLKKCTKITPSLTIDEISRQYPKLRYRNIKYIYDFNGGATSVEDRITKHQECTMRVVRNTIIFSCYNCSNIHCYFKLQKERLQREGFNYRD